MRFKVPLWAHQQKTLDIAKIQPEYALLFDMGTGKTALTVNILRHKYYTHKKVLRTLILCPIVVCRQWHQEFTRHSNVGHRCAVLTGTAKQRVERFKQVHGLYGGQFIAIINYEGLGIKKMFELIDYWRPEAIVCDESQRIKNPKAKRTAAAIALGDKALYRYILTGTPILNTPMDVFAQYRFLDKGQTFGQNFYQFRARYFYDKNAGMPKHKYFPDWRPHPDTEDIFNRKIYKKATRVLKAECLDLPPLVKQKVEVALSAEQNRVYSDMHRAFISYINDSACVAELAVTKALRLQQIISGFAKLDEPEVVDKLGIRLKTSDTKTHRFKDVPRLKALSEVVDGLPDKAKFIVWACFRENYRMIQEAIGKLGIGSVSLVGGISEGERTAAIDAFQSDDTVRCMIANQGAGGVGVNLTAASYAIYYSRSFNLEHDLQSEARCYRGGSEVHEKITRIDIVAPGTIDEAILKALESKYNQAEAILAWRKMMR